MITIQEGVPGTGKTLQLIMELILKTLSISVSPEGEITNIPENTRKVYSINLKWIQENPNVKRLIDDGILTILHPKHLKECQSFFNEETSVQEMKLDWLPKGAILIIDEVQTFFPKRSSTAALPCFIQWLQTHRHWGNDVIVTTQDAMLVDEGIRKLSGDYRHLRRLWGTYHSRIYKFSAFEKPSRSARALGINENKSFDKRFYGWYKSSEEHTHRRKIPLKVIIVAIIVPIVSIALLYRAYSGFANRMAQPESEVAPASTSVSTEGQSPPSKSTLGFSTPFSSPPPKKILPYEFDKMSLNAFYKVGDETRIAVQISRKQSSNLQESDKKQIIKRQKYNDTEQLKTLNKQELELLGYQVVVKSRDRTPYISIRYPKYSDEWHVLLFNTWH